MKVAISIPDSVFHAAEQLSQHLGKSRSQLYAEAIAEYVGSRRVEAVTEQLDAVYAAQKSQLDEALHTAQLKSLSDENVVKSGGRIWMIP